MPLPPVPAWLPQSLRVLPDAGRDGETALALVATRGADGRVRLEAKGAQSGRDVAGFAIR